MFQCNINAILLFSFKYWNKAECKKCKLSFFPSQCYKIMKIEIEKNCLSEDKSKTNKS